MRRRPFLRPTTPRATRSEPIVPMINVVFLLLIFFLMTAQITPPDPFPLELPSASSGDDPAPGQPLFLSQTGDIAFGPARGPEALTAAHTAGPIRLHADQRASGETLATLLRDLAALGATDITLVTLEAAP
ncbi:ExbD/TolR family protein [Tropicibacter oceani]|uniref:Biopolymer transporter ExbD n=1 Tax=Tropicibacter oceani TaxID=3058420 RepID=A0ABY8QFT7_9RHOB|nr:biopolymer transporter ExbD [Tropicibacter oceani]WGW03369.1 biopolymer transporter ExbD [Tropicibacter oceani]